MSTRQKSFFDQDHRSKTAGRPNWGTSRPLENKTRFETQDSRRSPPEHPISVSSQSRNKLKAFNFAGSRSRPASPEKAREKENEPHTNRKGSDSKKAVSGSQNANDPDINEANLPPSTPATRLPLADLIGNAEDALRRPQPKEDSPEEQLGWIPNSSNSALTPGQHRKRAHSSSPLESSQHEIFNHFGLREPLDLQNLQQSLKTPHADPVADLWNRYATDSRSQDMPSIKQPAFAHILNDSSPHALPRTPGGSVGGLRRWASCGMEWPTSNPKRRRTNGVFRDQLEQVFESRETAKEHLTKVSKVEMLVDQIQATLAQPTRSKRTEAPSSSSPLPDKGGFQPAIHISPINQVGTRLDPSQHLSQQHAQQGQQESDTSEYGDDDIDLDGMVPQGETFEGNNDTILKYDGLIQGDQNAGTAIHPAESASQPLAPSFGSYGRLDTIDEDIDEFGDDIDITAEDLDNSMPLFNNEDQHGYTAEPATEKPFVTCPSQSLAEDIAVQAQEKVDNPGDCNAKNVVVLDDNDDDDEFGGSDLDEDQFAAAEVAATQAYASTGTQVSKHSKKSRTIQRYLVKDVIDSIYTNGRGSQQAEKILLVEDEKVKLAKTITLRQSWLDTHCLAGAYVHVVGQFTKGGQIIIDDTDNLIIVHPDHLVSATAVADSFDCLRKAVLQDRVKATSSTSKPTVYGSILHEVFQLAMRSNRWDTKFLDDLVQATILRYVEGLFEAGAQDMNEALEHLRSKLPELQSWAMSFIGTEPLAPAEDRNGKKIHMSVSKLLDVEEHVWSPTYGLKGNIDATVEVIMQDEHGRRALTVPFEVKTGKFQSAAHRAQTALYTLLLSDRYDIDIVYGVLYYMETSAVIRIPAIRNELRHMVMQRNELASYVRERLQLPPMLQNPFKCGRCYAKMSCFLYHKLAEDGTTETAGVKEKFNEVVAKLKPAHQDFFKKWDHLLTREESEMFKFRRELWTMLSSERQKVGRCFAEVVIEPGSALEQKDAQKINRFTYTLVKKDTTPGFSFAESQITVGEPIVVSSEKGHFALANGYVTKISARRIGVAVDRKLHNARRRLPDFDELTNQAFRGIMEVDCTTTQTIDDEQDQVVYRLDKDEFSNGMATVRNNLLAIMDDSIYRSYELRELIVENKAPVFNPVPTAYTLSGSPSQLQINSDQCAAVDKIMSAKDYALVLGMPGTGKTTTIAHIIRALVARGKSVLLTSYTHTAVDNILLKLRDSDISVLRLGVLAKIHPEVQEFANLAAIPRQSIEELEQMYMTPQVVATTCLGIGHQIFHKRVFDYCIVDEASQITLPVCLGPIRMARTFVLVGDHYQLPPLVQNKEAAEGGLDISLFKLLSDRQPDSVVNLEHQYRMCEDIMSLSGSLIYSGRLKCGNETVAERTLHVPKPDGLQRYHHTDSQAAYTSQLASKCYPTATNPCWLSDILSPQRKVVFANTDRLQPRAIESASGSRITNTVEATLTSQLVLSLIAQGIEPSEIGIITFYRSQLALLRHGLKHTPAEYVEMHTADKFQGRDKEVIIVSCVRSNDQGNVGDLLKDWRRVNVALTRARSKLMVVGSKDTLNKNELLKKFLDLVESKGWMMDLAPNSLEGHSFEEDMVGSVTQKTPAKKAATKIYGEEKSPNKQDGPQQAKRTLGESKSVGNRQPVRRVGLKRPDKVATIGHKTLLKSRPVLQDLVNDILGENAVS